MRERDRERESKSYDQQVVDTTIHERFRCDYVHTGVLVPTCPTDRPDVPPPATTRSAASSSNPLAARSSNSLEHFGGILEL